MTIIDSYHQYLPFLSEMQYKLKHLDSLFYSWNGGLGMNFWPIVAYYLASPLNLLLYLFPESKLMEAFSCIVLLKISFAGWSFSYYLSKRYGKKDFSIVCFSAFYALSGFVVGYAWNIMWMDCIALLPLIMLGLHRLVKEGKGLLYLVTLALAIICNYYMAIMICIFLAIYFFVEVISLDNWAMRPHNKNIGNENDLVDGEEVQKTMVFDHRTNVMTFFKRGLLFAGCSLSAAGIGGVIIIPAYQTLLETQSASNSFPTTWKLYYSFWDLFGQQMAVNEPTSLNGMPNLYAGVFALILVPLYLCLKNVRWREKIANIVVAAFLLISLNVNVLAYIWHGFHFPNGLPGRFSFIYIFLLLMMSYQGFIHRKHVYDLVLPVILLICALGMGLSYYFGKESREMYVYLVSAGGLVGYYILLMLMEKFKKGISMKVCYGLFLLVMVAEVTASTIVGWHFNGTVSRSSYVDDQETVAGIVNGFETDETGFERSEVEQRRGRDDVVWYHMKGLSIFSSTANAGVDQLLKQLGFFAVTNKYSYEGATPETDAIFGIKNLISNKRLSDPRTFELVKEEEDKFVYSNQYALSLGFMSYNSILDVQTDTSNAFEAINNMMSALTHTSYHGFSVMEASQLSTTETVEGCEITGRGVNSCNYSRQDSDASISYQLSVTENTDLYASFTATHASKIEVEIDGEKRGSYDDEDGHIIHIGNVSPQNQVVVRFKLDKEYSTGKIDLTFASHDMNAFYQADQLLAVQKLKVNEYTSTSLNGTILAQMDGVMFTSIPYDEGWTITVDGEVVTPEKIAGAFIGVPLSTGEHEISMKFVPKGFWMGLIVSILSIFMVVLVEFVFVWNKKSKKVK